MNTCAPKAPKQVALSSRSPFTEDDEPIQFLAEFAAAPARTRPEHDEAKPFVADPAPRIDPGPATSVDVARLASQARLLDEPVPPVMARPEPTPAPTPSPDDPRSEEVFEPHFEAAPEPIRQLALRAIFGIDRELGANELLYRAQALPGVRMVSRIPTEATETIDSARRVLTGLNFGNGPARLTCDNAPLEFIREGRVMLAVQSDGGFAPGTRETLILIARELGNLQ